MKRSGSLRRRTPLRARKGMARTGPIQRKARLAPINRERLAKRREGQYAIASGYHKWTMDQPCAACGSWDSELRSDPAHVGRTKAVGAKADHVLSLCRMCHLWEGEDRGGFNEAFRARHGVYPVEMARYRYELYHRESDGR